MMQQDADRECFYAEVLLPLPLSRFYTYKIRKEEADSLQKGCRVVVPFGKKNYYTGIVMTYPVEPAQGYETKSILTVLDPTPVVTDKQLQLWQWIADYYLSSLGEVFKAALPSGFKIERKSSSTFSSGYKPKLSLFVSIDRRYLYGFEREELEKSLERAPKQKEIFRLCIEHLQTGSSFDKRLLLQESSFSQSAFNGLIDKGVLQIEQKEVGRLSTAEIATRPIYELNSFQEKAYHQIGEHFSDKEIVLLHGVTSSGKTEIYIHLIEECLQRGKQVLYLLPEIALTKQITDRLQAVFGNNIGIYHSKFPDAMRVEVWNKMLSKEPYQVILGVRSSVFLPFSDLGLVIIDEEHETSYKQQDPAPRYHGGNTALVLASLFGAKTLMGTATPSVESYSNAMSGKYGYVSLTQRHKDVKLPLLEIVDSKTLYRKKMMQGHFSPRLLELIEQRLQAEEQVILFQNRRGFSPMLECKECAFVPKCPSCDVSLTYHKRYNKLSCHYCGYDQPLILACPSCGSSDLTYKGFGTEKIEDDIQQLFPSARLARMDFDTTRTRNGYEKIISDFENRKIDILIGTQMISKGLDFGHVSLVGILNADNLLNRPDFRAFEKAYQMLLQVSGRAGRRDKQGTVVIQTAQKDHPVIQWILDNDYDSLYQMQIQERTLFKYPPLYRLLYIHVKHKDPYLCKKAAEQIALYLKKELGKRVLGPDDPIVAKIQNYYIKKIVVKYEITYSPSKVKQWIESVVNRVKSGLDYKSVGVYFDVDPV